MFSFVIVIVIIVIIILVSDAFKETLLTYSLIQHQHQQFFCTVKFLRMYSIV